MILNRVVKVEFSEKIFKQILEGGERVAFVDICRKTHVGRGNCKQQSPKVKVCLVCQETSRRSVWLEPNEQGEET